MERRFTRASQWIRSVRTGRTVRPIAAAAVAVLACLGLAAPGARAEAQRVEVVGTYPIRDALRGKVKPRDEAIQSALWEGVSRVALDLLAGESGSPDDAGEAAESEEAAQESAQLRKALGRQPLPYTRSFRIVEDRGERPVLVVEEPGVRSEYLVVVEVLVDVDRVRAELARAGLVAGPAAAIGPAQIVLVDLVGLERHAAFRAVVDGLRSRLAAQRVETLEFAPGRQRLRVTGPFGARELADRLSEIESAELLLEPVAVDAEDGRIEVVGQWLERLPEDETTPIGPGNATSPATPRP